VGAPRWMRWFLVASLALNLLVAGVVLGDLVGGGPPGRGRPVELTLGPLARALGEEDRRAVLRELRGREGGTPSPRERRAAFADLVAAIRAEPFDADRAAAALAAQAERMAAVEREVQAALMARLAAMSPEARAAFADRLEGELGRGPPGRG
jgi:uncharacterized membrane protein